MPKTATKREPKKPPPAGSFWTNEKELFCIVYSQEEDDVLYVEDCRMNHSVQMRLWDWNRTTLRRVHP